MIAFPQIALVLFFLAQSSLEASLPSNFPAINAQNGSSSPIQYNIQRVRWEVSSSGQAPGSTDYIDFCINLDAPIDSESLKHALQSAKLAVRTRIQESGDIAITAPTDHQYNGCYMSLNPFKRGSSQFMRSDWQETVIGIFMVTWWKERYFDTTWYYRLENGDALAWGVVALKPPPPNALELPGLVNGSIASS